MRNIAHNSHTYEKKIVLKIVLVIAALGVLSVVIFFALNPLERIKDSRNSRRADDVQSILTSIHQSIVDNKGALPTGLTTGMAERQLGTAATGCAVATNGCAVVNVACLDMTTPLVKYLKAMPIDPAGTAAVTGYSVVVDANNIVTLKACGTEGTTPISVSR